MTDYQIRQVVEELVRIADSLETIAASKAEAAAPLGLKPEWAALLQKMISENDHYEPDNLRDY